MLLNRVLHNVPPEPTATASHLSNLVRSEYSQLILRLWWLLIFKLAASTQTLLSGCGLLPLNCLKSSCWFLGGREAPRCSRGEIYASGSCRNADSVQRVEREKKKIPVQPQLLIN